MPEGDIYQRTDKSTNPDYQVIRISKSGRGQYVLKDGRLGIEFSSEDYIKSLRNWVKISSSQLGKRTLRKTKI